MNQSWERGQWSGEWNTLNADGNNAAIATKNIPSSPLVMNKGYDSPNSATATKNCTQFLNAYNYWMGVYNRANPTSGVGVMPMGMTKDSIYANLGAAANAYRNCSGIGVPVPPVVLPSGTTGGGTTCCGVKTRLPFTGFENADGVVSQYDGWSCQQLWALYQDMQIKLNDANNPNHMASPAMIAQMTSDLNDVYQAMIHLDCPQLALIGAAGTGGTTTGGTTGVHQTHPPVIGQATGFGGGHVQVTDFGGNTHIQPVATGSGGLLHEIGGMFGFFHHHTTPPTPPPTGSGSTAGGVATGGNIKPMGSGSTAGGTAAGGNIKPMGSGSTAGGTAGTKPTPPKPHGLWGWIFGK